MGLLLHSIIAFAFLSCRSCTKVLLAKLSLNPSATSCCCNSSGYPHVSTHTPFSSALSLALPELVLLLFSFFSLFFMGFLWCRRINSLCGEFYNKIKKDADAVQQPTSGGVCRCSRFPLTLFFAVRIFQPAKKKETDFYAASKLMFEFLLCYCLPQGR